ncbi:hypothetical protein C8Q77DRAFT_1073758 [Trametes polyzona]|nr:hypothetical protein C8Q77DRAFT_1073758 [Trametes polyzona]
MPRSLSEATKVRPTTTTHTHQDVVEGSNSDRPQMPMDPELDTTKTWESIAPSGHRASAFQARERTLHAGEYISGCQWRYGTKPSSPATRGQTTCLTLPGPAPTCEPSARHGSGARPRDPSSTVALWTAPVSPPHRATAAQVLEVDLRMTGVADSVITAFRPASEIGLLSDLRELTITGDELPRLAACDIIIGVN